MATDDSMDDPAGDGWTVDWGAERTRVLVHDPCHERGRQSTLVKTALNDGCAACGEEVPDRVRRIVWLNED